MRGLRVYGAAYAERVVLPEIGTPLRSCLPVLLKELRSFGPDRADLAGLSGADGVALPKAIGKAISSIHRLDEEREVCGQWYICDEER